MLFFPKKTEKKIFEGLKPSFNYIVSAKLGVFYLSKALRDELWPNFSSFRWDKIR